MPQHMKLITAAIIAERRHSGQDIGYQPSVLAAGHESCRCKHPKIEQFVP
jgi:hypothetical protein